ncbi:hypothetical protein P280DRAFT_426200 [Massarina eburnea CBS 473.64]|uniref:GH16 domain-containing protein n=1 Tax=Massarina eburnea CBS 473.64 TaxID=1395130 RepID=A0A6A6S324_9PLEO|nr:hypothetical protein P280DRAFT_426200 [Massarina eburnea CBS 473.64]
MPKPLALSTNLARYTNTKQIYLGVDNVTNSINPRASLRLESKKTFDHGLLVADFAHLPAKGCGMWPSFWVNHDPSKESGEPYSEIDILENVNLDSRNWVSMYTSHKPCALEDRNKGTGTVMGRDCWISLDGVSDSGEAAKRGCKTQAPEGTFGEEFNRKGGGVWGLQLETDGIRAWYFPRDNVPKDLATGSPDPEAWGKPVMEFGPGTCDVGAAWKKMRIIFNITFCGGWAGGAWGEKCREKTGYAKCEDYVGKHAEAFDEVHFLINSVKVFTRAGAV